MTSAAYSSLLEGFIASAKAARLNGDTAAAHIWDLAAARLTQAEADSLQEDESPVASAKGDPTDLPLGVEAHDPDAAEFARRVQRMSIEELRERVLTQRGYLRDHGTALQGLDIPAEIMRPREVHFPQDIRRIVSALLDRLTPVCS